jgi:hypothetical protein
MINLSKESVLRFQKLMKDKHNADYSFEEAKEAGTRLVGLFDLLIKMDKKQNPDNYKRAVK